MRWAAGALVLAVAVGCARFENGNDTPAAAELVRLPPDRVALCRRSALLRPACPTFVPATRYPFLARLSQQGRSAIALHVFDLERGGEDPRRPGRARPPAVGHLTIAAGNVDGLAPFVQPLDGRRARLGAGLMTRPRTSALFFGRVRWGGKDGALFLAPPLLHGGQLGNHLCFRWRSNGTDLLISLHGWEPLPDAAATLEAIVESTRS